MKRCGRVRSVVTATVIAVGWLLVTLPASVRAQLSAPSFTNSSSANELVNGLFDNPTYERESGTQTVGAVTGTTWQSRYFGLASADCGAACGARTETLATNYTVSWSVTAPSSVIYRLTLDTRRTAGLTCFDEGNGNCVSAMNNVMCTPSGGALVSGVCTLADPADNTSNATSDVNVNQTAQMIRCGQGTGATQAFSMNFTWSQSATTPSTAIISINSDESAVRLGGTSDDGSETAADYPGVGGRTQANDGHFMTVTYTNLCGNGVVDTCPTVGAEQCDQGGANGTAGSCCTTNCTFKAAGTGCNDGETNPCTDDVCSGASATCQHPPDDSNPCTDGAFCNGTESCSAGVCGGSTGNPCAGHNTGPACNDSCNEAADNCTAPDAGGTGCVDGLFCTATDTCNGAGTCVGTGNPCPGQDVGPNCNDSCDEGLDNCTADDANGTSCAGNGVDDCTNADTCSGGTCDDNDDAAGTPCTDTSPPSSGNCQDAQCDGSGACDQGFANEPDGTDCDDSLFCTQTDDCTGGTCTGVGDPCPGPDNDTDCSETCNESSDDCTADDPDGTTCRPDAGDCDVQETCSSGACPADAFEPEDTACGSNADTDCTDPDTCDAGGVCEANDATSGTQCGNQVDDECTDPDTCDGSGTCDDNDATSGTPCGDSNDTECTDPDQCDGSGICEPNHATDGTGCGDSSDTDCSDPDACLSGVCDANDEDAGEPCDDPSDTECDDPDACDGAGACDDNLASMGTPCTDDGEVCTEDECDGAGTCDHPAGNAGVECRGTTTGPTCDEAEECDGVNNTCPADGVKGAGESCRAPADLCDAEETCDGASAACPADGVEISGTPCRPAVDECDMDEDCDGASPACPADVFQPDGTGCDDGQFCTATDACTSGSCGGTGSPCGTESCDESNDECFTGACPETPVMCRTAAKSQVLIKDKMDNAKDKLQFKWVKGQATSQTEFGDPTTTANYALCIYSADGLIGSSAVPPSTSKWFTVGSKGYKYLDNSAAEDGITRVLVKGSTEAKAKALVKGKGDGLPDFTLPFMEADLPITVQLRNNESGVCVGDAFSTPKKNVEGLFKAKNQ